MAAYYLRAILYQVTIALILIWTVWVIVSAGDLAPVIDGLVARYAGGDPAAAVTETLRIVLIALYWAPVTAALGVIGLILRPD